MTELILGQVERLRALLAERIRLNTAGISETAGSRHEDVSTNTTNSRYDGWRCLLTSTLVKSGFFPSGLYIFRTFFQISYDEISK